jgi:hypothetical protein
MFYNNLRLLAYSIEPSRFAWLFLLRIRHYHFKLIPIRKMTILNFLTSYSHKKNEIICVHCANQFAFSSF